MDELVRGFAPILGFMLIPIWIPLFGVAFGALGDRIQGFRGIETAPSTIEKVRAGRELDAATVLQSARRQSFDLG